MQIKLTDENEEAITALVKVSERTRSVEANIAIKQMLLTRAEEVEAGRALIAQEKKARKRVNAGQQTQREQNNNRRNPVRRDTAAKK